MKPDVRNLIKQERACGRLPLTLERIREIEKSFRIVYGDRCK